MQVEGSMEDNGNIKLDPFMQPPILKAFFEKLPVKDLANCRLANKTWYRESLSTWRSKTSNVTLEFNWKGIVSKINRTKRTASLSLRQFLDMWEEYEWSSFPFKKFSLYRWKFEIGDLEQERFIDLVGEHITSLSLWDCSFDESQICLQRIMYQAFPNLQSLQVDSMSCYWGNQDIYKYKEPFLGLHGLKSLDLSGVCLPDLEMNMLSHYHKLESLHIDPYTSERHFRELLTVIRVIREQDQTKLPLKNFHDEFTFELGQETARSLETLQLQRQLNLPLQCLTFFLPSNMDYNLENKDIVRDILRYHSSSLTHLEFQGFTWTNPDPHGLCTAFPFGIHFENLESLCLFTGFCDNLNYLLSTPNLRRLRFGEAGGIHSVITSGNLLFANSPQLEIGNWTWPLLTDLTIQLRLSFCNLRKLVKWMPNVERLRTHLNDVQFSFICEHWRNLREVTDWGIELTDGGVIGNVQEAGDADKEAHIGANIAKLIYLYSFGTRSSKLTSAFVYHGLLKLANLQELKIGFVLSKKLGDEVKEELKERRIAFNSCL